MAAWQSHRVRIEAAPERPPRSDELRTSAPRLAGDFDASTGVVPMPPERAPHDPIAPANPRHADDESEVTASQPSRLPNGSLLGAARLRAGPIHIRRLALNDAAGCACRAQTACDGRRHVARKGQSTSARAYPAALLNQSCRGPNQRQADASGQKKRCSPEVVLHTAMSSCRQLRQSRRTRVTSTIRSSLAPENGSWRSALG